MEIVAQMRNWIKEYEEDLVLGGLLLLTACLGYGLGVWQGREEQKIVIQAPLTLTEYEIARGGVSDIPLPTGENRQKAASSDQSASLGGAVSPGKSIVASKNGTRYYFVRCSGASRIAEKNKIYFASEDLAQKAGLTLAANCR